MWGMWLVKEKILSWNFESKLKVLDPNSLQNSWDICKVFLLMPLCFNTIETLSSNSFSFELRKPLFSDPAIGWERRNFFWRLFFFIWLRRDSFTLVQSVIKSAFWKRSKYVLNPRRIVFGGKAIITKSFFCKVDFVYASFNGFCIFCMIQGRFATIKS